MATAKTKKPSIRSVRSARQERFIAAPQVTVSERDFALIVKSIENPPAPNEELVKLASLYRRTVEESR